MAEVFDLFGDPVREGQGRRGRPAHLPTQQNRNRVNMLLACGWANQRIADTLRISLPTLRRYYSSELKFRTVARDRLDMRRAELLWQQCEAGNVSAMRDFERFLERNDRMGFEQELGEAPPAAAAAGKAKPGKKEMDAQRAMEADAELMAELDREAAHNSRH